MTTFLAVCAGVATLCLVISAAFLVWTLWQVRCTALEAQRFVRRLDRDAGSFVEMARKVTDFTRRFKVGWLQSALWAMRWVMGRRSSNFEGNAGGEAPQRRESYGRKSQHD
ncbi:MAG: hypothetical protein A3G41_02320 [Elusimicrobia bacterium RIFCSPLOWO2_12_FULL_59_9]|nr:MAG: hypothetical protein A3G41_02320 [Elusimicrobia bacterium RIFCSPLOWO2_12_FULL_59_9]